MIKIDLKCCQEYIWVGFTRTRRSDYAGGSLDSVKEAYLGPSNEGEYARETRGPHSACKVRVLKRYGVGEDESGSFCQDLLEQMLLKWYQSHKCFS